MTRSFFSASASLFVSSAAVSASLTFAACGGEAANGPTPVAPTATASPPIAPVTTATTATTATTPPPPPKCAPREKPADCTSAPTFAEVEPVMRARCNGCHSPGAIAGEEHDFSDPPVLRAHKERMVKQLLACKMPPRRPISEEEAMLVLRWAACAKD